MSSSDTVTLLFQFLGVSAIISGVISAGVNYFFNFTAFKKQKKIDHLAHKISLYSYLLFQLDRMFFTWLTLESLDKVQGKLGEKPDTKHYAYSDTERKELFKEMTKRIEQEYPLFNQDFMKLWVKVSTLFSHPSIEGEVPKLNSMLLEEYNKSIEAYKDLTGVTLDKKS